MSASFQWIEKYLGQYECSQYIGTSNENGWHRIIIVPATETRYLDESSSSVAPTLKWINEANCKWSLTPRAEGFDVGNDCPYYASGHTICRPVENSNSLVLLGPGNERYYRIGDLPPNVVLPSKMEEFWKHYITGPSSISRVIKINTPKNKHKNDNNNDSILRNTTNNKSAYVMTLSSRTSDWRDMAYLAAIPSSSHINGKRSVVIAPFDTGEMHDDSIADFLTRYQPTDITLFDTANDQFPLLKIISIEDEEDRMTTRCNIHHEKYVSLEATTIYLSKVWETTENIVLVSSSTEGYAMSLVASSFAARIDAPIFFVEASLSVAIRNEIQRIGAFQIFIVGDDLPQLLNLPAATTIIRLSGVVDVINFLRINGFPLDYFAVVNPNDRLSGISQKLSLTAPLYTSHREGLVIPIPDIPVYLPNNNASSHLTMNDLLHMTIGYLNSIYTHIGRYPEHVALIGSYDVIPVYQTKSDCNGSKIYAVCDIPYGQPDFHNKYFRDIAVGRIFTDSICAGSLLAARTVTFELLFDGNWERKFIETGLWGFPELRPLFRNAGFRQPEHLLQADIENRGNLEVAAILHKDHSGADGLGNAINTSTATLYAPSILLSRGCHAAGIDEKNPSVAGRMLGRGCVAYVGAPRSPTTQNTLTEIAFMNALLFDGMTLGQAMRTAFNKATTHWLENSSMTRYCIENEMLFGDPALRLFTGTTAAVKSPTKLLTTTAPGASATLDGDIITITGPEKWEKVTILRAQLKEWNYCGENLFTYVAPGVDIETRWCGKGNYDRQDLYFTAAIQLPTATPPSSMKGLDVVEIITNNNSNDRREILSTDVRCWWTSGKYYQHVCSNDEIICIYFRVRLMNYDMKTGAITSQLKRARFQLCGL